VDATHGVLLGLALAGVAGVVALLWQRARLAAEARAAREAEAAQRQAAGRAAEELNAARERVTMLSAEAARLEAAVEGLTARLTREAEAAEQRLRERLEAAARQHATEESKLLEVHAKALEAEREARRQLEANLTQYKSDLEKAFAKLAGEALSKSSSQFLELAETKFKQGAEAAEGAVAAQRVAIEHLVEPIQATLKATSEKLLAVEKTTAEARSSISEQVAGVVRTAEGLRVETSRLATALRRPEVRGRWGEMQLARVVEAADMKPYCDFAVQETTRDAEGRAQRPDMVVRLPNGREVAVDAKCNLDAYLDAVIAGEPAARDAALDRFAGHVSEQAKKLGDKRYWSLYEGSPDFVVMFIPGDALLDAALQRRADLLAEAASRGVILATPGSLIGLLRVVAMGFREQRIAESARQLHGMVVDLLDRLRVAVGHVEKLGSAVEGTVKHYNAFVGSFESRVLPQARAIEAAGAKGSGTLPELTPVTTPLRALPGGAGAAPSED
jgi:DNA recombination protein RmuC